jgi:hypothetical protein
MHVSEVVVWAGGASFHANKVCRRVVPLLVSEPSLVWQDIPMRDGLDALIASAKFVQVVPDLALDPKRQRSVAHIL